MQDIHEFVTKYMQSLVADNEQQLGELADKIQTYCGDRDGWLILNDYMLDSSEIRLLPALGFIRAYKHQLKPEQGIWWKRKVMTSARRRQMVDAAEAYYRALAQVPESSEEELSLLKSEMDRLVEPFADETAFVTFLRMKRLAAEAKR